MTVADHQLARLAELEAFAAQMWTVLAYGCEVPCEHRLSLMVSLALSTQLALRHGRQYSRSQRMRQLELVPAGGRTQKLLQAEHVLADLDQQFTALLSAAPQLNGE